jgi:hypothetical protein
MKKKDLVEKYANDMGIKDWQMAATIVLMRPLDIEFFLPPCFIIQRINFPIRNRMEIKRGRISKEEMRKILHEYMSRTEDVLDVLKTFPSEILLIMRSMCFLFPCSSMELCFI